MFESAWDFFETWGKSASALSSDLVGAAAASYMQHVSNPLIINPTIVTLVDYRIKSTEPRMWVLSLFQLAPLFFTRVAHGVNSGPAYGAGRKEKMSNNVGSHQSCLGGFATLNARKAKAGQKRDAENNRSRALAMRIEGLDAGVNDKAKRRGILFHGAHYVNNKNAGRSYGCLATAQSVNNKIIPLIKDGTFFFAYCG